MNSVNKTKTTKRISIDVNVDDLKIISKASLKDLRSRNSFIVFNSVKEAKKILGDNI